MSAYNGRRGPNVSQYVANLNQVPSPTDLLDSPPNLEFDNDVYANTDFIDWNAGSAGLHDPSLDLNFEEPTNTTASSASRGSHASEPKMDFNLNTGNFDFDFSGFQNPVVDPPMQHQAAPYNIATNFASPVNTAVSPVSPVFDQPTGKKRKLEGSDSTSQQSIDEAARVAAEEDKRRRNTAASARFRVKKKQREQALEKTAKEMSERVSVLETRIQQLETENTWLKGLITEKNGGTKTSSDVSAILKKHMEENAGERITGSRTDGVGTKSEDNKA